MVPLHKKKSVYWPDNYRGIHLTSQLPKVIERLLRHLFMPFVVKTVSFGPNQFAYTKERGARDALAHLVLVWLKALSKGRKLGVHSSDVSGAFDRVSPERLLQKLRAENMHPIIIEVIKSRLRDRKAYVVVGGERSAEITFKNIVFQGTVWGPPLWVCFYEDARRAINEWFYTEVAFVDDLNVYRELSRGTPNDKITQSMESCPKELRA